MTSRTVTTSPNGSKGMFNELGRDKPKRPSIYDDFLYQLRGAQAVKVYEEMSKNDATVGAILYAIEQMAREVEWHVEPWDEDDGSVEVAQFVEECMEDMAGTWDDFMSAIMTKLTYGFSFFETVFKRRSGYDASPTSKFDDGKIGWRKQAFRPQNSLYDWVYDESGGVQGFVQGVGSEKVVIPIEKGLLFRTKNWGNAEGESVLRRAYRAWWFKKRTETNEGIGLERDLAGLPMAKIPLEILLAGAGDTTYSAIKDIVTRTKADEQMGIIWPNERDIDGNPLYEFELLSAGGTKQFDTNQIIARQDAAIARTVLADFILLGHTAVGSRALADPKIGMFQTAMSAWLDSIQEVLNRHAVPRLLRVNGMNPAEAPRIMHGELKEPSLAEIGSFYRDTAQAGMPWFPDIEGENKLRDLAGWEPLDPDEAAEQLALPVEPPDGQTEMEAQVG